ncbi:MAG: excisionase [Alphaproteobacteria bacterium PA3]|nr:MAG: excisionase [Alphaproteobacteria bacterium PA3]
MSEPNSKLAFTVREACAASTLGKTTIYAHIASGRLKAVRIGGRTVIPAESLRALVTGEAM